MFNATGSLSLPFPKAFFPVQSFQHSKLAFFGKLPKILDKSLEKWREDFNWGETRFFVVFRGKKCGRWRGKNGIFEASDGFQGRTSRGGFCDFGR